MRHTHVHALVVLSFLSLSLGCATQNGAPTSSNTVTTDSADFRGDFRPIVANSAVIVVRGLSCPKCANNVNLQLDKVAGVGKTHIDMGAGEVQIEFDALAAEHPSKARLAQAITDAGFTVVDIRTP